MKVLGLDLSLQSTGVALIDWSADGLVVTTNRVRSTGKKGATVADTAARLEKILSGILPDGMASIGVTMAVIESPSYGSTTPGQHERAGLWWKVACGLVSLGIGQIATAAPATLKVYATGRGAKVEKDEVLAAVIKRYPQVEITGNDIADAMVLAAMGSRHLGAPIDDPLPQTHLRAMASAKWPA